MRRRVLVAAAVVAGVILLVVVISLGYDEVSGEKQVGQTSCVSDNRNLLAAQSVTSAGFVPCFGSEIAGWQISESTVEPGSTQYTLASPEVPGASWSVELQASCQPAADAVPLSSAPAPGGDGPGSTVGPGGSRPPSATAPPGSVDEVLPADGDGDPAVVRRLPAGVSAVESVDDVSDSQEFTRTEWFQFTGGCVTSTIVIPARFDRANILGDIDRMLVLVPRSALDGEVRLDTRDSLSLDP